MHDPKPPFFCSGTPKSGTTFLQRMLDAHPEVSCPSEQGFSEIFKNLRAFYAGYNDMLKILDRRTGGQGIRPVSPQAVERIFACHLQVLAEDAAQGKPRYGLNDNIVHLNVQRFQHMFPAAKIIRIVRNPIDRAISIWHHNERVHQTDHMPALYDKFMHDTGGTLEGCIVRLAQREAKELTTFLDVVAGNPNVLIIRYEDFSQNRAAELKRLYGFLGAKTPPPLLKRLADQGAIGTMASASNNKEFFRGGGRTDYGAGIVAPEVCRQAMAIMAQPMQRLGYDLLPWQLPDAGC